MAGAYAPAFLVRGRHMKMNKDMERIFWIKQFGQPLYEDQNIRIICSSKDEIKLFRMRTKSWYTLVETDDQRFSYITLNEFSGPTRSYLIDEIQSQLRDAIIERELLS